MATKCRKERDFLGAVEIAEDRLFGVMTYRAVQNFPFSGKTLADEPEFLRALAAIKKASALANKAFGLLSAEHADAIATASDEIAQGRFSPDFVVDILESSGGTSLNMNVNEVLANRALQLLGHNPGDYQYLHPNDHINRSQSTNDVIPSAINIACHEMLGPLIATLSSLAQSFRAKAVEFESALRIGRTCLQDAQPMTLGQAFGGYAEFVARCAACLTKRRAEFQTLPLGGTAIGTGFGAPAAFRPKALSILSGLTGIEWRPPQNSFDAMQSGDHYVRLSSELKACAGGLSKIGADLMFLASGPHGGIAEIKLPAVQAGSSIMPSKVNPVYPMALVQTACVVAGNDAAITMAAQHGQLEINPYEPVILASLFSSIRTLLNCARLFDKNCIHGLQADTGRMERNLLSSSCLSTAFTAQWGYQKVAELVRQANVDGRPFLDLAIEAGMLSKDQIRSLLIDCTTGS